jgi:hypothetical protein
VSWGKKSLTSEDKSPSTRISILVTSHTSQPRRPRS